jgi:hypothetical protein
VPPELESRCLAALRGIFIARGRRDDWYTAAKYEADFGRLVAAGAAIHRLEFDAGHEWTAELSRAAGGFLNSLR